MIPEAIEFAGRVQVSDEKGLERNYDRDEDAAKEG